MCARFPLTEQYLKRRRTALCFTLALLALSVVILIVGFVSSTRTDNVAVAGFYPGIIVSATQCVCLYISRLMLTWQATARGYSCLIQQSL